MALGQFFGIGTAGNNGVECRVYVSIVDDGPSNRSLIDAELQFRKSNGFQSQGNFFGTFTIHGSGGGLTVSGNKTLPGNGAWVSFGTAGNQWINHGADGRAPYTEVRVNGVGTGDSSDFDTPVWGTLSFDSSNGFADYQRLPGQVSAPTVDQITPNSARINWIAPSSPVTVGQYDLHVCGNTLFNNTDCVHYNWTGNSSTSKTVTGMTPGKTYYVRVRAQSSEGEGAWSPTTTFQTVVATPPGISVVASPAGSAATVSLTPPGGSSGVTSYDVTYTYIAPAPIPNPASVTVNTVTNSLTVQNLVPGATYAWSAVAYFGTYASPASTPFNLVQPKPNTAPGDYFDGNTSDTPDINYAWTGTTNLSTSTATGVGVDGWEVVSGPVGSAAALYRTTGGYAGSYAAMGQITRGTGTSGFLFGQANVAGKRTDVEAGAMYVGSMYVQPSRQQRLVAVLTWVTAAGVYISDSIGNAAVSPASVWTRLLVADVAPATAAFAMIRVIDVTGEGWSAWVGGETLRMDAAMVTLGQVFPYFDGDTVDTADFSYEWDAAANASISQRNTLVTYSDPLNDPDCVDVPPSPRPPTVPSDCIVDVGLWRRYWAYIPAAQVSDWITTIPTLVLSTFGAAERQVRIRFYADPFNRPAETVNTEDFCSEQILSYIPPNTEMTIDGVTQRVWASVSGGPSLTADHLLYGSDGTPAEWPSLSCGIGYWVSFDVPNDAPAGNLQARILMTQRV